MCRACILPSGFRRSPDELVKVIKLRPSLEGGVLHQVVNIFHLVGVLVLQRIPRILSCVSLRQSKDPAPRLRYCFLAAPPLSLPPLPFLINNGLNLPFGTQGRSRNGEHRKTFMAKSPTGFCSVSVPQIQVSVSQDCPHFSSS